MRAYTRADEECVRLQAHVRAWTRSALLEPAQADALLAGLPTDLKRANQMLRPALAFFTAVIVAASVGLAFVFLRVRTNIESGTTLMLFGVGCAVVADRIVARQRVYRFGVEEALAMAAVVLLGLGAGVLASSNKSAAGLTVAAAIAFLVYRRLGPVYAAVVAMCCAAAIPLRLDLAEWIQRLVAAAALAAVFVVTRILHRRDGDDYPGDEYASLKAAGWLGVYLLLNLRVFDIVVPALSTIAVPRAFYWSTFAATWLMPFAGLTMAIRERDRQLLAANLVMALLTLGTDKPYLGWTRASWDPMLLGALMAGAAIALRRWLARGPGGERAGFTPVPLLEADRERLRAVGTLSVALQPHAAAASAGATKEFDGGRSGGGGAGAGF
jgi:hypothetical protein